MRGSESNTIRRKLAGTKSVEVSHTMFISVEPSPASMRRMRGPGQSAALWGGVSHCTYVNSGQGVRDCIVSATNVSETSGELHDVGLSRRISIGTSRKFKGQRLVIREYVKSATFHEVTEVQVNCK